MSNKKPETLRLRFVGVTDFRKSEQTMFDEMMADKKLRLGEKDVVMFRSGRGDQLVFVQRKENVETSAKEKSRDILPSRKLRISWGTWSEIMIADYARMVGIHLENLPTLEEFFTKLRAEARAAIGAKS